MPEPEYSVHHPFMHRCLELALKGAGRVAPNPLVGAVLLHGDRIIGEGWHQYYGGAHAEVNAVQNALDNGNGHLLSGSTLYVSLEPCAHHGKTPPCTDLILQHRIPRVLIGTRDPFPKVNGRGIDLLRAAGVEVTEDILGDACRHLNRRFFRFHREKRPWVMLKWAQTADGYIAGNTGTRQHISNAFSNRLVHRWRSEEAAILVGSRTALLDNPQLNNRLWPGPSPVRLVLDRHLQLPGGLHLFDGSERTIVFNLHRHEEKNRVMYYRLPGEEPPVTGMLNALEHLQLQSVLVEGGAGLLRQFIDSGCWDEARVITATACMAGEGLPAPQLVHARRTHAETMEEDVITYYTHTKQTA